jgi:hypothetical protein
MNKDLETTKLVIDLTKIILKSRLSNDKKAILVDLLAELLFKLPS